MDAAFFEDWSEWASLDDLPRPDRRHGYFRQRPIPHSRYRCILHRRIAWIGGAAFELSLPPNTQIAAILRGLLGARQHPGLLGSHRIAYGGLSDTWYVPAQHWRELRAALPQIKTCVLTWVAAGPTRN